ncbi:MAG: DUF58 domain-containing protein [Odoribacter sp.]|nr:DUF58 domain-containing protein [Odoribacter sp.]
MGFIKNIYLTNRLFILLLSASAALVIAFVIPFLYTWVTAAIVLLGAFLIVDIILVFSGRNKIEGYRSMSDKLSNGDDNTIKIIFQNNYNFPIRVRVIDETPVQFQIRKFKLKKWLASAGKYTFRYTVRPVRRGEYEFNKIRIFVSSPLSLIERRFSFEEPKNVPVYPSFIPIRKYEMMVFGNRREQTGKNKVRSADVSLSFDQIKFYVPGDDPRTINWKATAKCARLMVNTYTDERSQPVYCIIDKGRTMQPPFNGMTLLDYSINASLALSDIILKKGDKAGLLTFSNTTGAFVKADNQRGQLNRINEVLYNQKTNFLETDFEQLYIHANHRIHGRSFLMLFTNFDTVNGMRRHLPALKRLASKHLLLLIMFEDAEIDEILEETPENVEDIYFHTIATSFKMDKFKIVAELRRYGIYTLLTRPQNLSVNAINSYLDLKRRFTL